MRSSRRGTTLVEVLVGCAVFSFVMLASLAILNIVTGGWRVIESKSDVTRALNRFECDITQELRRASIMSVGIYTPRNDYRWALWFKTPMNGPGGFNPATGVALVPLSDPVVQVVNAGRPMMQRYVLYYLTRMSPDEHVNAYGYLCTSYGNSRGPDTACPHKWIVKKDIYLTDPKSGGPDSIGLQGDPTTVGRLNRYLSSELSESALRASAEASSPASAVWRVQVVGRGILSLEFTRLQLASSNPMDPPVVAANGPIILFDVKAFKSLAAADKAMVGQSSASTVTYAAAAYTGVPGGEMIDVRTAADNTGTVTLQTASSIASRFSAFTVQLDNRVIPENP